MDFSIGHVAPHRPKHDSVDQKEKDQEQNQLNPEGFVNGDQGRCFDNFHAISAFSPASAEVARRTVTCWGAVIDPLGRFEKVRDQGR
jgi:hypothetical protein